MEEYEELVPLGIELPWYIPVQFDLHIAFCSGVEFVIISHPCSQLMPVPGDPYIPPDVPGIIPPSMGHMGQRLIHTVSVPHASTHAALSLVHCSREYP